MSKYYPIEEETARVAKIMNSMDSYEEGSATKEYEKEIDEIYSIVEEDKNKDFRTERLKLCEIYAKKYAEWINQYNKNKGNCPSVLISGPGNFPEKRKKAQIKREEKLLEKRKLLDKIRSSIENYYHKEEKIQEDLKESECEKIVNPFFKIKMDKAENRIKLFFEEIPSEDTRNILKKHGWHWSPRNKAWQRQLTRNAILDASRLSDEMNKDI